MLLRIKQGWVIEQWDVEGAYLNADLHHTIYVKDKTADGKEKVWKLNKALYGLKQAGHEWRKIFRNLLKQAQLERTINDEGCYIGKLARFATHVDDILATAETTTELNRIREVLNKAIKIGNLGAPEIFLGIKINLHIPGEISLTQEAFIEKLVQTYGIVHRATSPTTTSPICDINAPAENEPRCGKTTYRGIVGALLHISRFTRPDIAVIVNCRNFRNSFGWALRIDQRRRL
jgi:hypothetical protein